MDHVIICPYKMYRYNDRNRYGDVNPVNLVHRVNLEIVHVSSASASGWRHIDYGDKNIGQVNPEYLDLFSWDLEHAVEIVGIVNLGKVIKWSH